MKYTNLEEAVKEANRFAEKATAVILKQADGNELIPYGPDPASLRRASLDLTKSLSKLRRSDWVEE